MEAVPVTGQRSPMGDRDEYLDCGCMSPGSLSEPGGHFCGRYSPPTSVLGRVLAMHQLADILPGGVVCTCGAELATLNPPLDDGAIKGEPLALAVHQLQELEEAGLRDEAIDRLRQFNAAKDQRDAAEARLERLTQTMLRISEELDPWGWSREHPQVMNALMRIDGCLGPDANTPWRLREREQARGGARRARFDCERDQCSSDGAERSR